ncbi:MAG: hypothetical protein RLZZ387_2709 [Chloroflexota bacterium]|jgi:hypothetical protein
MPHRPQLGWIPERTWIFVVGTLEWKHDDLWAPFPKENRRDAALVELFRGLGVPSSQIAYLQDRQASTRRIQQTLEEHLAGSGPDDLLVLYYCGHGDRADDGTAYFASYDADGDANQGWVVDTIPATVERCFAGSRALLIADCCCSGSLADATSRHARRVAYACLASSLANETSTGNWTFTEGLLAGLRGQAFVDGDGDSAITLRELAAQIADSMVFAEEQLTTFATAGGFNPEMVIAAARPRPDPRVGGRVEVNSGGEWYPAQIVDARGDQLKVHYYGYEESDDEWVAEKNVREPQPMVYKPGAAVEVHWRGEWYTARVLAVQGGAHHIQYNDYGPEWNEWVPSKRIRPSE